jgi:hypothetical protein
MRPLHPSILIPTFAVCALFAPQRALGQESALARYGVVDELVLADSSEVRLAQKPKATDLGLRGQYASASFIVLFIVDTLGRVEMPSVSFGNDVPKPFMNAACIALHAVEYMPIRRDGIARRVVTIENWSIQRADTPGAGKVSPEPLRNMMRSNGIIEMLPIFAQQPHCP